jgi:hypothetical protein
MCTRPADAVNGGKERGIVELFFISRRKSKFPPQSIFRKILGGARYIFLDRCDFRAGPVSPPAAADLAADGTGHQSAADSVSKGTISIVLVPLQSADCDCVVNSDGDCNSVAVGPRSDRYQLTATRTHAHTPLSGRVFFLFSRPWLLAVSRSESRPLAVSFSRSIFQNIRGLPPLRCLAVKMYLNIAIRVYCVCLPQLFKRYLRVHGSGGAGGGALATDHMDFGVFERFAKDFGIFPHICRDAAQLDSVFRARVVGTVQGQSFVIHLHTPRSKLFFESNISTQQTHLPGF